MKKILNDFLKREIQRFCLSIAGLILCLIFVASVPGIQPLLPIFAVGYPAVIILNLIVSVTRFFSLTKADIRSLSESEKALLEQQYAANHPVYKNKIAEYGNVHLLHDFIISMSWGRLIIIPLDRIENVNRCYRHQGVHGIPYISFVLDTGKDISIDFLSKHGRDLVWNWLIERIETEKIERGTEKASLLR